ncbi:helix-turn-helix transcriptional regulator [Enterococcus sp. DIV0756]|uniref:helix-turn-helix transcriptional regulator n=1 Tax=Enterococcus sp. DIV0756 TaxID=2774636 RepID=UPI003F228DD6
MNNLSQRLRKEMEDKDFKQLYEEEQLKLDIADLLFELREKEGLNQTQFAKKVKKSRSSIVRMEKGITEPSISMLEDIVEALGKKLEIKFVDK